MGRALSEFGRSLRAQEPREGGGGGSGSGSGPGSGSGSGLNPPDLSALPSSGFGFGNLEFESRDFDWDDYARQVYVAIWRAWHNRLYLSTDAFEKWSYQNLTALLDHQNRIRFTVDRSGELGGIALETPSGCVPLDESALDALREVVLPPLPTDFPRAGETVHVRFIAYGEIRAMRPSLQYLRSRGYF
jgi:TonB family protein